MSTLTTTSSPPRSTQSHRTRLPRIRRGTRHPLVKKALQHRADLLAAGVFLTIAVWIFSELWADPSGSVLDKQGNDHLWFQWLISHGAYSVTHFENPFFSLRQNFPDGVNMMANTSALGVTLPLAPITYLFGPGVTYAFISTLGLAGTAFSTYYVLSRYCVNSPLAAAIGGGIAGFSPSMLWNANYHVNFLLNFLLPLIIVAALTLGNAEHRVRRVLTLSGLVIWQFFINPEMLLLTAAVCGVIVLGYIVMRFQQARQQAKRFTLRLLSVATIVTILLAYPMWVQFKGAQSYTQLALFHDWAIDLNIFTTLSPGTLFTSTLLGSEYTTDFVAAWSVFGWPVFLLTLIAAVFLWRGSITARLSAIIGVLFCVMAMGTNITFNGEDTGATGPWSLFADLPVFRFITTMRMMLIVTGAVAVLLALAVDAALARKGWVRGTALAAIALVLVADIPAPVTTEPLPSTPAFISQEKWRAYVPPGQTLLTLPPPNNPYGMEGFRYSAISLHRFAIPQGFFLGPDREGEATFGAPLTPASLYLIQPAQGLDVEVTDGVRNHVLAGLTRWKVAVVILPPNSHEAEYKQLMTDVLGKPPAREAGVWLWNLRD